MGRIAVEHLLFLMDDAFEGTGLEETTESHSLVGNLRTVTKDDWAWVPPRGHRSIADIVGHVGACKHMYDDHAFGPANMTWDDSPMPASDCGQLAMADVIDWVREGHRRLREHVASLDDAELLKPRRTNWGELRETRWIIAVMIEHDLYHAGEINHIRALHQGNDHWSWQSP